jgi:hypothetical protein
MYRGIEIGHPIYSLLFANLTFALMTSVVNVVSLMFSPCWFWSRVPMFTNVFALLFNITTWSVISGLRYLFIVHSDWNQQKFPNLAK